uniref:FAD-binding PCMH-type domain-containing protein n=1 Tax=Pyrodinium bahamense TaxID=73915 RepID=A0A7S0AWW3_9DINO|mmetsp:Transcript_43644/g.121304  ORF Transcript_43644/g.121304 Transcript_43644/m.121304 type:complete len:489 (+) Transcript_43644:70-1536(+)
MAERLRVLAGQVLGASGSPASQVLEGVLHAVSRGRPEYSGLLERNWSGNVHFNGTPAVPETIAELRAAVCEGVAPVRVVGRGHSFTELAECAGGTLISLARLNRILNFQEPKLGHLGAITVEGGTTFSEIASFLKRRGALRNLPSCPQFTVAGAIATGTHGSGVHLQNLATHVREIEFVKADGSLVTYSRAESPELLEGSRVHLGCLGVVSKLTLDVVPFYEVHTYLYSEVPQEAAIDAMPELWARCNSLSIWCLGPDTCYAMFRHFVPHWEPALAVEGHIPHKVLEGTTLVEEMPRLYTDECEQFVWRPTGQHPWHDGLTLTMEGCRETPIVTADIQAEFFVPLSHAQEAARTFLDVVRTWTIGSQPNPDGSIAPGFVFAVEFRQIKGDGAWLSPHPVDSLGLHISFDGRPECWPDVLRAVPLLERALRHFGARAHWGKLAPETFAAPGHVEQLYGEGLRKFRALCHEHDPEGKFRNAHVQRMLFGA